MNKNSIILLCALIFMPLACHAMLRTVAGKMPLTRIQLISVTARSMYALSDAQRGVLKDRLQELQNNLIEEEKTIARIKQESTGWFAYDRISNKFPSTAEVLIPAHIDAMWRKYLLEDKIVEIKMKLAEDKK